MSGFRLSPLAATDIEEIWEYIAAENPTAATRVRLALLEALRLLSRTPGIGHRREDLTEHDVKFWPVFSYLIVYSPDTQPLEIVRVLHGARDIGPILG
ncbi:MAG: type II toxin-antitoxin system RelE/ParE family toxin [Bryobacteraceae bacterium]|nr:type II toxin-antitoxin system RelE/ParE family toxin [Bryobacteraceae bacterium]